MNGGNKNILAINGGSSSIKFSVYEMGETLTKWLSGKVDRIGLEDTVLTFKDVRRKHDGAPAAADAGNNGGESLPVDARDLTGAGAFLIGWLGQQLGDEGLAAVGHRLVYGLDHHQAGLIDDALLDELQHISEYDPDHLPGEIALIRLFRRHDPGLPQVACFDTAFHATMPKLARLLPIPRRYEEAGLRRYGFHGLSYAYIMEELVRIAGPAAAHGSVILAHLGNGASLAAVKNGVSVDTTMGFTPAGGVVMGTRPGDLDPGVAWWLFDKEGFDASGFNHFINHECGLLGISETTSDMRDLLSRESSDERAAEAIGLFCYQVRKMIGAYAAVLGGLDTLVFTGGIGESSAIIRSRICAGMGWLGIELDQRANAAGALFLSVEDTRVGVYAIPTDEEWMIARTVSETIKEFNKSIV
jgi:acetate kinase